MPVAAPFDRDRLATWYAMRHLSVDDAIRDVFYLPTDAPDREIRLVEVVDDGVPAETDPLVPVDFGVDIGSDGEHSLLVIDVSVEDWERVKTGDLALPAGWRIDGARPTRKRSR